MNNARRKEIDKIIARIEELKGLVANIAEDMNRIAEEEREAYENLPAGMQCSMRGDAMEASADNLESATWDMENLGFDEVIETLENAKE